MALFTKSIQATPSEQDGLRICIMRRPGENEDWDLWVPKLSPSHELLNAYKYEGLTWQDFQPRFQKEVIEAQSDLLKLVVEIAQTRNVTLLCWEETPDQCHRSLIAQECQKLDPELSVTIQ